MSSLRPWLHHDGSELYLANSAPDLGDIVEVRLRVSRSEPVSRVHIRAVHDGEPRFFEARVGVETAADIWWVAELPIRNPRQNYRWLVASENHGQFWLNAAGAFDRDVPDASDFAISAYPETPGWARSAVVYQIFPDRFAASGRTYDAPHWAVRREWSDRPTKETNPSKEWFGGDLWGVAERLDYLQDLGVDVVYSTPFFPAGSTHRYDASTFGMVDPLLGGDEALIALSEAAAARGMSVMGDITLNHCGMNHAWFLRAQEGDAETRDFFYFDDSLPYGYECWFGVRSLPKFNYGSQRLNEVLLTGEHSIFRRWLQPPFNLAGWRVDVANMSGRNAADDFLPALSASARTVLREEGEDKLLIAEHFHDAGADLAGAGWQGTMGYTIFMRPVWSWLVSDEFLEFEARKPAPISRRDGVAMVESMQDFASRMPWRSRVASWILLDSHDTARVRTVVGDESRHEAAVGLLIGMPGTPMIFAGDELGAEGHWGEDSRTTMPWDEIEQGRNSTLDWYRQLLAIRRSSPALANGGLRWLAAESDCVVFARESGEETLLFVVYRKAGQIDLQLSQFGWSEFDCLYGVAELSAAGSSSPRAGVNIWRVA